MQTLNLPLVVRASVEGELNPLLPHLVEIGLSLVVFGLLFFLVKKYVAPAFEAISAERTKAIDKRRKEVEVAAEKATPGLRAEVAEMFAGKTYVLFLYTYLKDVRLVFAPPASVGNFGGEVDNWEWPRHTGDFSFMRAYTARDGTSATYSPQNIPYKPKRFI